MKSTDIRSIDELIETRILVVLAIEFAKLMEELGYSTSSSLFELNDSAPAPAKKMADVFKHGYQALRTEANNRGAANASATTSPAEP